MTYPPVILIDAQRIERAKHLLSNLPEGKVFECVIREHKSSRSLAQNKCLHGWCKQISQQYAESTGKFYPMEHWKIYLKKILLGTKLIEIGEEVFEIPISTKDLKVDDFRKFLDGVDHYAGSELHIILERGEDYSLAVYGRKAA